MFHTFIYFTVLNLEYTPTLYDKGKKDDLAVHRTNTERKNFSHQNKEFNICQTKLLKDTLYVISDD